MARKQRSRSRTAARRATQPVRAAADTEARPAATPRRVGASGTSASARGSASRTGALRAVGAPSAALLRNAEWERAHVIRDFRRIGVVVAIMAVLLVIADVAVNLLLK